MPTLPLVETTSPTADARIRIARILLEREVGQRIPTVQDLQSITHAGTGTVIKALRTLEAAGAVSLSSHGHQGTLVVERDVGQLWNEGQLGIFVLGMPPPGPVEQYGIVETIQQTLTRMNIPVSVEFHPGARRRLSAVFHSRAHAAVTSVGAFEHHRSDFAGLMSLDLGESSFYASGSLVVVENPGRARRDRLKVGIDRGSYDHQFLTEREFSDVPHDFVECRFVSAPAAVLEGRVDAAVWHSMPTVIPPALAGLTLRPLSESTQAVAGPVCRAALVSRGIDAGVNALLRFITREETAKVQARLLKLAASADSDGAPFWPR